MIGDAFVFDGVAHVFNFDAKNPLGRPGEMFSQHIYAFHQALTPPGETVLPPEEFLRQWTVEDIRRMVYDESDTDMLCAMPLPLTDLQGRSLALGGVRGAGRPRPRSDRVLGHGQPARRA